MTTEKDSQDIPITTDENMGSQEDSERNRLPEEDEDEEESESEEESVSDLEEDIDDAIDRYIRIIFYRGDQGQRKQYEFTRPQTVRNT